MRDLRSPRQTLILAAAAGLLTGAACKKDASAAPGEGTAVSAAASASPSGEKACCKGLNDCKGKGGCAVPGKHDCAGKNECKGQGGCDMHCPPKK